MKAQWYVASQGWLHNLDLRVTLLMSIAIIALCAVWGNCIFLAVILIALHIMFLTDRVPARSVAKAWGWVGTLCMLVFIVMLLNMNTFGSNTVWQWGWWHVTSETLMMSVRVILRIADILFALLLTLFTTNHGKWIQGLVSLKIPLPAARRWVRWIEYIPSFDATVTEHMRNRAVRGGKNNILSWFASLGAAWNSMREQARDEMIAVRTRGLYISNPSIRRTLAHPAHMRVTDWLVALATVLITAGIIVMIILGW